jgi:hypothetical protein
LCYAFDADLFQPPTVSAQDSHCTARNFECLRQNVNQLIIGGAVNRRGRQSHSKRTVMFPNYFTARRTWRDLHSEYQSTVANLMLDQSPHAPIKSVPATAARTNMMINPATNGEMSIQPSGGSIRRNGPSSGSVALIKNRMTRLR